MRPGDLVLADVDNDSDLDLLLPNFHDPSVSVGLRGPATHSGLPVRGAAAVGSATTLALTVYPNPTHGTVTGAGMTTAAEPLVLYDLLGREQDRQPGGPFLTTADLSPGGTCYVAVARPRAPLGTRPACRRVAFSREVNVGAVVKNA